MDSLGYSTDLQACNRKICLTVARVARVARVLWVGIHRERVGLHRDLPSFTGFHSFTGPCTGLPITAKTSLHYGFVELFTGETTRTLWDFIGL